MDEDRIEDIQDCFSCFSHRLCDFKNCQFHKEPKGSQNLWNQPKKPDDFRIKKVKAGKEFEMQIELSDTII